MVSRGRCICRLWCHSAFLLWDSTHVVSFTRCWCAIKGPREDCSESCTLLVVVEPPFWWIASRPQNDIAGGVRFSKVLPLSYDVRTDFFSCSNHGKIRSSVVAGHTRVWIPWTLASAVQSRVSRPKVTPAHSTGFMGDQAQVVEAWLFPRSQP